VSRGSLLVSLVALLLIVGTPLLRGGSLHAQGACLSVDPPCPPRPDLAVLIRATNDTSRTTPVIVNFSVRGINPANVSSASATVNGGPVNSLNWYLDPGGMTATGSADVHLLQRDLRLEQHVDLLPLTPDRAPSRRSHCYRRTQLPVPARIGRLRRVRLWHALL
jgi:hypothetical protein